MNITIEKPQQVSEVAQVPAPEKKRVWGWPRRVAKPAPVASESSGSVVETAPETGAARAEKKKRVWGWPGRAKKSAPAEPVGEEKASEAATAPVAPAPLWTPAVPTSPVQTQPVASVAQPYQVASLSPQLGSNVLLKPQEKALGVGDFFKGIAHNLYSWQWTKGLVYWLILSAGTASDFVFLMASFWMSINANVHELILTYMSEKTAKYITYLATSAYVALPIFIVTLAVVQTVSHLRMWNRGGYWSRIWTIIFGIPAVTFLVMDFVTISFSVANVTFTMPGVFVVVRADSAFIFAFGSLIYFFLGKPQEADRLAKKDSLIAGLRAEMKASLESMQGNMTNALASLTSEKDRLLAGLRFEKDGLIAALTREKQSILVDAAQEKDSLLAKIDVQNDEIESLKGLLERTQRGFSDLHKAMTKSDDDALRAFGEECISWLKSGIKTAMVDDIVRFTGVSKRRINNAIARGTLRTSSRNKELVLVDSLVSWLKTLAAEREKDGETGEQMDPDTGPMLRVVPQ